MFGAEKILRKTPEDLFCGYLPGYIGMWVDISLLLKNDPDSVYTSRECMI